MPSIDDLLYSICLNASGEMEPVIKGMDYDYQQPLGLTFRQTRLIKDSERFVTTVSASLKKSPESFNGEIEFDMFPLYVIWMAAGPNQGLVHLMNAGTRFQTMTYLTKTDDPADQGICDVLESMSPISDLPALLGRFPMRPLSITAPGGDDSLVTISAELSSAPSADPLEGDAVLSAAALSFAAAYFLSA